MVLQQQKYAKFCAGESKQSIQNVMQLELKFKSQSTYRC